jgi:8-oxo-dGTP pyrophosphatase MutT (NUDIX family)
MNISAGVAIIFRHKLLICHPTNNRWVNSFSLPKGGVDEGETYVDAAIRECWEEVGIKITPSQISNLNKPIKVDYVNKAGVLFKQAFVFIVKINSLSEIGLEGEIVPKEQLQASEIDWAGFLTAEEADEKIFYRFKPILDLL